jgi:hypothetical protein
MFTQEAVSQLYFQFILAFRPSYIIDCHTPRHLISGRAIVINTRVYDQGPTCVNIVGLFSIDWCASISISSPVCLSFWMRACYLEPSQSGSRSNRIVAFHFAANDLLVITSGQMTYDVRAASSFIASLQSIRHLEKNVFTSQQVASHIDLLR